MGILKILKIFDFKNFGEKIIRDNIFFLTDWNLILDESMRSLSSFFFFNFFLSFFFLILRSTRFESIQNWRSVCKKHGDSPVYRTLAAKINDRVWGGHRWKGDEILVHRGWNSLTPVLCSQYSCLNKRVL